MAEFWRGEITLRKLRVLVENLPKDSPARWHLTDGKPYGITDSLLWRLLWATWETQVLLARVNGNSKAKMPAEETPAYPWSEIKNANSSRIGSLGDHTQEEALAYLKSLEI